MRSNNNNFIRLLSLTVLKHWSSKSFAVQNNMPRMKSLVLIGGGHANIQVMKSLPSIPEEERRRLNVTLIDQYDAATYSGMIPGCVSKLYSPSEASIPFKPLANWAGVNLLREAVVDIHPDHVTLQSGEVIAFDCLSLDIGSSVRGVDDVEGVREYTIPTRPIHSLISRIEEAEEMMQNADDAAQLVVVGGGMAGIEMALNLRHRWSLMRSLSVTIINSDSQLLPRESASCRDFLSKMIQQYNITVLNSSSVSRITNSHIQFDDNAAPLPYTHCIWAAGAAPHSKLTQVLRQKHPQLLSLNARGWISTNSKFQSLSAPNIFAVGDCASMSEYPNIPKAGVYAVRAGPLLFHNLISYLFHDTKSLQCYTPQPDFLRLINFGDGTALGFRFNIYIYGKWVWSLKDSIDKKFIQLFLHEYLPDLLSLQHQNARNAAVRQFDVSEEGNDERIHVDEAAQLLISQDADAFNLPWKIINDMIVDEQYASDVVHTVQLLRHEDTKI